MRHGQVDPVGNCETETDEDALEQNNCTTMSGSTALGLPVRCGGSDVPEAEAGHETTDDEVRDGESGALEGGAKDVDDCAENDCPFSAKIIADPDAAQGAEKAAKGVDGHDGALEGGIVNFGLASGVDSVNGWECLCPSWKSEKAASNAVIVSESVERSRISICFEDDACLATWECSQDIARKNDTEVECPF